MLLSQFGSKLISHYNELPKSKAGVPYRHNLQPSKFVDVLPSCVITVLKHREHLEITLCGGAIESFYGLKLDGLNVFDKYPEDEIESYATAYAEMLKQPCGLSIHRLSSSEIVPSCEVNIIAFPLANREGKVDRMIMLADIQKKEARYVLSDLGDKSGLILEKTLSFKVFDIGHGAPESDFLETVALSEL